MHYNKSRRSAAHIHPFNPNKEHTMELNRMKIGAAIAARRKEKGLTQEQLAARLGVSAPAVSKWETEVSLR